MQALGLIKNSSSHPPTPNPPSPL